MSISRKQFFGSLLASVVTGIMNKRVSGAGNSLPLPGSEKCATTWEVRPKCQSDNWNDYHSVTIECPDPDSYGFIRVGEVQG